MSHLKHASILSYITGFVLSIVLTGVAYILVTQHAAVGSQLIAAIVALAVGQMLVQLFFFLHLGRETKPRWKLVTFIFMLVVLGILVFGSLWIMQNLNYNMGHDQMDSYMLEQSNKGF